jgi:hypothetical protein
LDSEESVVYQFKIQLEQSDVDNLNLTKELEAKELIVKDKDEEIKRLKSVNDDMTKKVQSLNQRVLELEREVPNAVSIWSLNDTMAARNRMDFF